MHTCLVDYCIGMSYFNADVGAIGAFVSNTLFPDGFPWKAIDYKYIRQGFGYPQFFANCADILGLSILAVAVIPILLGLTWIFPQVTVFRRFEERYRMNIMHILMHYAYTKICFTAMLNWQYSNWRDTSFLELSSNLASSAAMFIVLIYPVYEFWHCLEYYRELKGRKRPQYI